MAVIEIARIQIRRGQELQTGIPQLDAGEFGWAQDTENLYIGKRIAEGASDDENTRILTEKDLSNIFTFIGNAYTTATLNSVYEYRGGILDYTTTSTLQAKLDSFNPSINDFGVYASTATYVQLDVVLQNAINDLFDPVNQDSNIRNDRRRILEIPAGKYYLTQTVTLPPYTKIRGAGPGLTKIKYINSVESMFKTVDIAGNQFEDDNMSLTTGSSRDVVIEGFTFEFDNTLSSAKSLISLDNVNHAVVQDCVFQTEFNPESTTTFGIVDIGVGIEIRGQGDNGTEKCRNVLVDRCEFNGLAIGVLGTGTVVTPSIRNSVFNNLKQGIVFRTDDTLQGPVNGYIAYNRFQDIRQEGIFVGTNTNAMNSSHLSTQNYFARVGGLFLNEFTTSSTVTSVISFFSGGNKTVDDYFARRAYADALTNITGFYYNPYVRGNTTIADSAVYTKSVSTGTNQFVKIPLNGGHQKATVNYQLYNSGQSRKGTIVANITPTGDVSMFDTYTYIESLSEIENFITADVWSGINTLSVPIASYPIFGIAQTEILNNNPVWYLTGSLYPGKSAYIVGILTSGTNYIISTDSDNPVFDFSAGGTWTLLKSSLGGVEASFSNTLSQSHNFITLDMNTISTVTGFTLDYQIDIQI
jgi:hypothetical protein